MYSWSVTNIFNLFMSVSYVKIFKIIIYFIDLLFIECFESCLRNYFLFQYHKYIFLNIFLMFKSFAFIIFTFWFLFDLLVLLFLFILNIWYQWNSSFLSYLSYFTFVRHFILSYWSVSAYTPLWLNYHSLLVNIDVWQGKTSSFFVVLQNHLGYALLALCSSIWFFIFLYNRILLGLLLCCIIFIDKFAKNFHI